MNWKQPKVYAVKHKDEATRAASRSGGIFTALSEQVLSNDGVIYGCALTDNFNAVHIRTDNAKGRNRMRGSKYIQSKLGDTFKNVKADLDARRSVLFSGTSCQVAGLKKYLGKEYDNQVKKCGMHIYNGKSRRITLKLQVWISETRKILDGVTMWKQFALVITGLLVVKSLQNSFMDTVC